MTDRPQFRGGTIDDVILRALEKREDGRGWLCELFRVDELDTEHHPRMAYVSESGPNVVRGPHEHVEQTDCFAFLGPGVFRLYLWDNRHDSPSYMVRQTAVVGEGNRQAVIIPPGVVHAYHNIGDAQGWVFNAPNRLYAGPGRSHPVDEIRHEDDPDTPFAIDVLK